MLKTHLLLVAAYAVAITPVAAAEPDVASLVKKITAVGPEGAGHLEAIAAAKELLRAEPSQLPGILAGMREAGPLAENWLRGIAESIAQRGERNGTGLPTAPLEHFLTETEQSPRARRLAFELLEAADPSVRSRLIPGMLNDSSLELRRDAVAWKLEQAARLSGEGKAAEAAAAYREALSAARDTDQVDAAAGKLRAAGEHVDLASHFGFLLKWQIIGPFDNTETRGFDVAYPPEREIDLAARYPGKGEEVGWIPFTTDDEYGNVDLTKALDKHKGAVAYAWCEFESTEERPIELRIGCINGNKVWLNGELLTGNHVYHARTFVDQYVGRGRLRKGTNEILVKVCQNEQTEDWAQRWQFQLRVCDHLGTAVLAADR